MLNLFVDIQAPPTIEDVFWNVPTLGVHVLFAFSMVAISAYALVMTIAARHRTKAFTSLVGFDSPLVVFLSGVEFTLCGELDVFSLFMEVGFLRVLSCAVVLLFGSSRLHAAQATGKNVLPSAEV